MYACCFADNVELIRETLAKYGEFYKEITGVGIDRYEILPNGVTKTAFDNGVVLFANHRSEKADSPLGELDGYGVKFAKE